MKFTFETESYNQRRYGKPYVAVIDFSESSKGTPEWGEWIGTPGYSGILECWAAVGDIIMRGQKDNRGNNSAPLYYQVQEDCSLKELGYSKAEAYKAWKAWQERQE